MVFRDLKMQYSKYKTQIDTAILKTVENGQYIGGSEVKVLEQRLAEYVGVRHCISCANGTDALDLVLRAWGIKEGDAVFVPDFTFFASGEVVSLHNATPIFIDVDEGTFNMNPTKLEIAIEKVLTEGKLELKVIMPVDLFGLPANYLEIEKISQKYNLKILVDSAQGFGGSINGKMACSFGDAATTSFFPAKPLGCYGDGGAIFTDDDELANLLNSLKIHGKGLDKYDNVRIGVNSRLDALQAAVLNVKLTAFIKHELDSVNYVADQYSRRLEGFVDTPVIPEGYHSSFAQYTIKLKKKAVRDNLQAKLKDAGIPTMIYYVKPMHKQGAFSHLMFNEADFEVTNKLVDVVLSLPMHPYLSEKDVRRVCDEIKNVLGF